MTDFNHPAPGLFIRIAPLEVGLLPAINDMSNVVVLIDDAKTLGASVARIGAQVLAASMRRTRALDHDGSEHLIESLPVIDVGPGDDERQRDATTVDQNMAFASIFFPDPSGSGRQLLVPGEPSSSPRRRFASARRCPPSRRIRTIPPPRVPRRSPLPPIRESVCGWRWHYRNALWATPSIGSPCAVHTQWLQTLGEPASAVVPRPACVGTFSLVRAHVAESAAPPAARTHRSPPTIRLFSWPSLRSNAALDCGSERSIDLFTDKFLASPKRSGRTGPRLISVVSPCKRL